MRVDRTKYARRYGFAIGRVCFGADWDWDIEFVDNEDGAGAA